MNSSRVNSRVKRNVNTYHEIIHPTPVSPCLQARRVTLVLGFTQKEGAKIARVYNCSGRAYPTTSLPACSRWCTERRTRETEAPLHQTPSSQIVLFFAARAHHAARDPLKGEPARRLPYLVTLNLTC